MCNDQSPGGKEKKIKKKEIIRGINASVTKPSDVCARASLFKTRARRVRFSNRRITQLLVHIQISRFENRMLLELSYS